jgi:hypothetical protein
LDLYSPPHVADEAGEIIEDVQSRSYLDPNKILVSLGIAFHAMEKGGVRLGISLEGLCLDRAQADQVNLKPGT